MTMATTPLTIDNNPPVLLSRPSRSREEDIEAAAAVSALPLWLSRSRSPMMMFSPPPPLPLFMDKEPIQGSLNHEG